MRPHQAERSGPSTLFLYTSFVADELPDSLGNFVFHGLSDIVELFQDLAMSCGGIHFGYGSQIVVSGTATRVLRRLRRNLCQQRLVD